MLSFYSQLLFSLFCGELKSQVLGVVEIGCCCSHYVCIDATDIICKYVQNHREIRKKLGGGGSTNEFSMEIPIRK